MIQEVGDYLQDKMSNHSKERNAYAHITLCVKNKFGLSYKDIIDDDYKKVAEYIDFLKKKS